MRVDLFYSCPQSPTKGSAKSPEMKTEARDVWKQKRQYFMPATKNSSLQSDPISDPLMHAFSPLQRFLSRAWP